MNDPKNIATEKESRQAHTEKLNRAAGILILIFLVGFLWIYGFASEIRFIKNITLPNTSSPVNPQASNASEFTAYGFYFLISAIFTVLGFGLIFVYFKTGTATSIFLSLFIVSMTMLLSPILQKFWYNVFIKGFIDIDPSTFQDTLYTSFNYTNIFIDFYNMKFSMINAISQLVMITGLIGRLSVFQISLTSVLYNLAWNLNLFLCIQVQRQSPDVKTFDDYQINSVYLFAACFGLMMMCFLKTPPSTDPQFSHSRQSATVAYLGTFFIFLAFCCTTTFYAQKSYSATNPAIENRRAIWEEAFINMFFAMSASIITTYSLSILFSASQGPDQGKIGIRQSLLGTISGAILYGSVAGTSTNIGAAIAIGILGGVASTIYFKFLFKRINRDHIYDSMGLVSILIVSFLGVFFISPIVLKAYYNYDVILPPLGGTVASGDAAGWVLSYVGITLGIGLASGVIIGFMNHIFGQLAQRQFNDVIIFSSDSGLKSNQEPYNDHAPPRGAQSAANLGNRYEEKNHV